MNPCEMCNASCCKDYVITVTSFDVARIMEKTGKKFGEIAVLAPLRLLSYDNDTVLECYKDNYRYEYVLALKSHPCVFLEKDRCSIHGFAPLVCRLYPYTHSGKIIGAARCPFISNALFRLKGAGNGLAAYRRQLLAYRKLVAKWNRKKGRLAECAEFLIKESRGK